MKLKVITILFSIILSAVGVKAQELNLKSVNNPILAMLDETRSIYQETGLEGLLDYEVFKNAMDGFNSIPNKRRSILTIVDFNKPSNEKRMFIIDIENRELLHTTYVAHGRNSGDLYAKEFSNRNGSYQSSLGFYLTQDTYMGGNGYSLRLDGLEKGLNDHALNRAIVVHGARYANPEVLRGQNRLGRSLGCPAVPQAESKKIIDMIKGGSVLFIYQQSYLSQSNII